MLDINRMGYTHKYCIIYMTTVECVLIGNFVKKKIAINRNKIRKKV